MTASLRFWEWSSGQRNGPAVYAERIRLAKKAGMKIVELVEKDIKPSDILTPKAFENALAVDMALGCSTNLCFIFLLLPMKWE